MKRFQWCLEKEERLFVIAAQYEDELKSTYKVDENHVAIKKIHREFDEPDATTGSVLYKLADFKFLSEKQASRKLGIFYRARKENSVSNFKISVKYPEAKKSELIEIEKQLVNLIKEKRKSASEACTSLSQKFNRTRLNIEKILVEQKILSKSANGIRLTAKYSDITSRNKEDDFSLKQPTKSVINAINDKRSIASTFYNNNQHKMPAILRSTDGTGYGKSYSVFEEYLKNIREQSSVKHRNLIFVTPNKVQIDIHEDHLNLAEKEGVPILPVLAREDLVNLDFIDWITGENNLSRYKRWFKDGNSTAVIKKEISTLKSIIEQLKYCNHQKAVAESPIEFQQLEVRIKSLKGGLLSTLQLLAVTILNNNGHTLSITDLINSNKKVDKLKLEIIERFAPFQIGIYRPCIFLMTTMKFDTTMVLFKQNSKGRYGLTRLSTDELVSGNLRNKDNLISSVIAREDLKQIEFLKDEFFEEDENNPFRNNNIAFNIIIDEEHEAYHQLSSQKKVPLLDSNSNLPHVLSSIYRAYRTIEGIDEETAKKRPLYEKTKQFFDEVECRIKKYCDISKENSLLSILKLFESNISYIQIEKQQVEQVIQIARNVFSFSPKRFFNEQALKRIHIEGFDNNTHCKLYYHTDEDSNPTLYDLHQIIMALLAGAAEMSNTDFLNMLGSAEELSQNSSLNKFIVAASRNKSDIDYMFDRATDANIMVDRFFTYFQPKTVFSLEPKKNINFVDQRLDEIVYVDFRLDLIKELPEVSVMRMLFNTQNALYSLSATTGFSSVYNGSYNFNALKHYGESASTNLSFSVKRRTKKDIPDLVSLREQRAKLRNVTFHTFAPRSNSLLGDNLPSEVRDALKLWNRKLSQNAFLSKNPYHQREYWRQLEAILLAAYDKKNTLILSLTGKIRQVFKEYATQTDGSCRFLVQCTDETKDIYDFTPFKNGAKLRLIFFRSQLSNEVELTDYTKLSDPNQRLIIAAPYGAAGTGLNLFVRYSNSDFKEDFCRLVLANSPFYSEVLGKKTGLNTLENWITLMKYYSDSSERSEPMLLKDFDVNLVNGTNYKVLINEHEMSIFKKMMQALGRVERIDSVKNTEIFMGEDLLENAAINFSKLKRGHNEVVLSGMSLINSRLMDFCEDNSIFNIFETEEQRLEFFENSQKVKNQIDKFFDNFVVNQIQEAREGNLEAAHLNEHFRSIRGITSPHDWLLELIKIPNIQASPYLVHVLENFYIDRKDLNGITICEKTSQNYGLTDLCDGDQLYRPQLRILPQYSSQDFNVFGELGTRYKELMGLNDRAFLDLIPHPAIIPLLKGNVGEYLLDGLLEDLTIEPLSLQDIFEKLGPGCYELFDRYIALGDKLICIDAKFWSSQFDNSLLAIETNAKAKAKRESVERYAQGVYKQVIVIYLNTRFEHNPLNLMPEHDSDGAFYLNLLKIGGHYTPNTRAKKYGSMYTESIIVNQTLLRLLTDDE